jgi:hypothetical protein
MWEMWGQFWFYVNHDKADSSGIISADMIAKGKDMLDFRYDSTIFEIWAYEHAGYGNHYYFLGDFENSINSVRTAIDLISKKFGEFHVRLIELDVWMSSFYTEVGDHDNEIKYNLKGLEEFRKSKTAPPHYKGNLLLNVSSRS